MRNKLFPGISTLLLLTISTLLSQSLAHPFVVTLTPDDFEDDATPSSAAASDWDDFGYSNHKSEDEIDPGGWRSILEPSSPLSCPSSTQYSAVDLELNYYSPLRKLLTALTLQDLETMQDAADELEAAAEKGCSHAQSVVAFLYGSGQLRNKSETKAFLYHSFAALGGNVQSKMALAYHYFRRNMHEKAVKLYAELAEAALSSFLTSNDPLIDPVLIHSGTMENVEALEKSREDAAYFETLEHRAQRGNAEMMYEIGTCYYFGLRGKQRDHRKAFSWILKAAQKGESRSMELLGEIYARGAGVEKNYKEALYWFTRASKQQHVSAYNGMGYLHLKGFPVEMENYTKAKEYFEKAEEHKDGGGHYNLAVLYLKGIGVKRDARTACHYFTKSANAGQPKAFFQLAKMFHTGMGLRKNLGMATALYKIVAEYGPWSSLSRWALDSYLQNEVGKAFLLYSRMAELGYKVAQSNAAWTLDKNGNHTICLGGSGFCTNAERYQRAHALWWQASEQGSGHAALQIGDAYYYGRGTERDYKHAAESYMQARSQSIAQAMYNLGNMHEYGLGLPYDIRLAKRYYNEVLENAPTTWFVVVIWIKYARFLLGNYGAGVLTVIICIMSYYLPRWAAHYLPRWAAFYFPPQTAAVHVPAAPVSSVATEP